MDDEEWRPIPSLPEYMASSWGRLMRIPFTGSMPYGGVRSYGGVPVVGRWAKDEKRYIISYRNRTYRVARLVCEAFHGPPPFPRAGTLHLDEDSRNNRSSNLKWGTQKENLNAPGFLNYCRSRTGDNSPYIKGKKRGAG